MRPPLQIRGIANLPGELAVTWQGESVILLHERPDGLYDTEKLPLWEALTTSEKKAVVRALYEPAAWPPEPDAVSAGP